MNNEKLTILYERLSHEDGRENESLSIENQKAYLEEYALEAASKTSSTGRTTAGAGRAGTDLGFLPR